jgi:hypothetical protein
MEQAAQDLSVISCVATRVGRVRVAPIEIANALSGPLDGVLGAETLSSFDIDLDLPGRRVTLYQGQSCAAAAPQRCLKRSSTRPRFSVVTAAAP